MFFIIQQSCSRPTFYQMNVIKNVDKVDMLLKVGKIYSLLRKSSWEWSLLNRLQKRGMIEIINGFYINFPFICYLGRICK